MTSLINQSKTAVSILIIVLGLIFVTCEEPEKKVLIKTPYGDMKVRLYQDTPEHRANFLKLVEEGFYDQLLFHRVIEGFMIQGGDPESKEASEGTRLGGGSPGYTLPAEINYPKHFHKKGALAAARQSDQVNPERESSGSQFYIVQGKTYSSEELDNIEEEHSRRRIQSKMFDMLNPYQDSLMAMRQRGDREGFESLIEEIEQKAGEELGDSASFSFPEEVREAYSTIGGTPQLDGAYTVFGEVEEGLNVIDSIAAVATDQNDRPVKDIEMTMEIIEE
ncbi:peptidylprolyl isomerase [Anaerophaga thermohalophila]|jgi:peptidyl-prolyl cis-trans isomerase B (cyclophilin B)|uniref:peptidylprolyl isomerase n=1 Tax=Anaerophaga thermohalophila TaxID=177400 RepID=UPI000313F23E|nr:peptidylprolyl isomerase [Anaerophaga thermohalophila]